MLSMIFEKVTGTIGDSQMPELEPEKLHDSSFGLVVVDVGLETVEEELLMFSVKFGGVW